jgi:hypothetical protein
MPAGKAADAIAIKLFVQFPLANVLVDEIAKGWHSWGLIPILLK